MSDLEPIRREIRADLANERQLDGPDPAPAFGRLLEAAASGLEPTDEWLEAIEEFAPRLELSSAVADAAVSNALRDAELVERVDLVVLREAAGLSVAEAGRRLGVSRRAMEEIEGRRPLGWLRVQASAVAGYLDVLGVRHGQFLRWMAVQLGTPRSGFAYGYRPRQIRGEPVPVAPDEELANEFRAWASNVLHEAQ